jgi:putative hydrolase of the HAD superfamily
MIQTLIFDLGRVLVDFDFSRGYRRMSERCGLPPEEVRARLAASDLIGPFESGRLGAPEFHQAVCELMEAPISFEEFKEHWQSVFLPGTLIPDAMLAALAARYRLVLLSNTNPLHIAGLERDYPILGHFHARVLSHEVGAMKPQPEIYRAALEQAECAPGECFFTDDVAAYVEAARTHGIDAVQFRDAGQIAEELRRRGVRWE